MAAARPVRARHGAREARENAGDAAVAVVAEPNLAVGADIRTLRKMRGMSLAELAGAIDRSVGWQSGVERGQFEPSISDLRRIAGVFEIPISFFFRNEDAGPGERGTIVRARSRYALGSLETGLSEELLSPDLSGDFEMIRSVFAPGASSNEPTRRAAQDGGYLVRGELVLWIGERRHHLRAGDSFQFQNQPYRWHNPGDEAAVVIWIVSPPVY